MNTGIRGWATRALGVLCEDWGREDGSSGEVNGSASLSSPQSLTFPPMFLPEDALDVFPILQQMARLAKEVSSQTRSNAELELDSIIEAAHDKMAHAHKRRDATGRWRQIYTDACILRSLADVFNAENDDNLDNHLATSSISRLDRAIIIAGPYGEGRLELILEFISQIQLHAQWDKTEVHFPPLTCDDSEATFALRDERSLPKSFAKSIKRINASAPPSLSAFISTWFREPFILTGYVRDWPALQEHPWRSLDYLRQVAGPGRIVPIEVGSDYRTDDWSQRLMGWDDFLASLEANTRQPVLYLAQHDLFRQFPALRDDIVLPDYVYAAPRAPENFPDYRPPANDEQLVANVWLGPAGTVSPAHTVRISYVMCHVGRY